MSDYKKIHLFDVDIKGGNRLMESEGTIPGSDIGQPIQTPIGKVGLQTCYDLRFAELSIIQRARGAEVLTFPSAFTVKTGEAHWGNCMNASSQFVNIALISSSIIESLLRARAIESQTYVVAAAQSGQHNANRESYGHAMVCRKFVYALPNAFSEYVHRISYIFAFYRSLIHGVKS